MKIKTVLIFNNGGMAVFDESGQQVPELQKSWMEMIFEFLQSKGIDPRDIKEIKSQDYTIIPFKTGEGWGWSVGR